MRLWGGMSTQDMSVLLARSPLHLLQFLAPPSRPCNPGKGRPRPPRSDVVLALMFDLHASRLVAIGYVNPIRITEQRI